MQGVLLRVFRGSFELQKSDNGAQYKGQNTPSQAMSTSFAKKNYFANLSCSLREPLLKHFNGHPVLNPLLL